MTVYRTTLIGLSLTATLTGGNPALCEGGYLDHATLSQSLQRLVEGNSRWCDLQTIGVSREGRAIHVMRVARPADIDPDKRPALLIVANIDGDHLLGSAVAHDIVRSIVASAEEADEAVADALAARTIYVIPRVNPDAAERFFTGVKQGWSRNLRPDDLDRDGRVDEDPPNDLDGDGLITMMRVFDVEKADRMVDPNEPRLDIAPDRDAGERPEFKLYVEGTDDDNDGEYNEDSIGGVDVNMNFMHGYREHADGAGPHQISEPESRALIDFVLSRQNIAAVLVYGHHDTLSKTPDGKGTTSGGAPKNIDAKDVALYKTISKRFKAITGLEKVPSRPSRGAFHAWAYAQFGVPSFSTPLWTRPEPAKADDDDEKKQEEADAAAPPEEDDDEDLTPSGIGDISMETLDELRAGAEERGFQVSDEMMANISPEQIEGFARQMGIEVRRVKGKSDAGGGKKGKAKNAADAAWLRYSDDERDGEGFVEWRKLEHAQLGTVEIGGWTPYFKTTPPEEMIGAISEKQVEFILELLDRFPRIEATTPEVTRLASGLYEVKMALVNESAMPAGTAMAVRNRRARPWVVRLSAENDQIITGARVTKFWSIAGSGGRQSMRWMIQAPDDSPLTITVYSEKYGSFDVVTRLTEGGGT